MTPYLAATDFIDKNHPAIAAFVNDHSVPGQTEMDTAVRLFYAVRDKIRYNPYSFGKTPEAMSASYTLKQGEGYCVAKAVLLCACSRAAGIPARLGFSDVKNHLSPAKLKADMGTDRFVFHGYTQMRIDGKWVKATPAFNLDMCKKLDLKPVEFNGQDDALFPSEDTKGRRHMEYIQDRGVYADLPLEEIIRESARWYPKLLGDLVQPDSRQTR